MVGNDFDTLFGELEAENADCVYLSAPRTPPHNSIDQQEQIVSPTADVNSRCFPSSCRSSYSPPPQLVSDSSL